MGVTVYEIILPGYIPPSAPSIILKFMYGGVILLKLIGLEKKSHAVDIDIGNF